MSARTLWRGTGCSINNESGDYGRSYFQDGRLVDKKVQNGSAGTWVESASYQQDNAGNAVYSASNSKPLGTDGTLTQVVQNYGADDKLRNTTRYDMSGTSGTQMIERYRYDALGRRIWRRVTWGQPCQKLSCRDYVERTVWAGSDILYEIRVPIDAVWNEENDNAVSSLSPRFYGTVGYTVGPAIDQPLGFVRSNYEGSAPFLVVMHYNWRGVADQATYGDGTGTRYNQDGTLTAIDFPARGASAYMNSAAALSASYGSWWGSIVLNKRDESGQLYLRNRYYDSQAGRFTQEDPIGLAGGANLYGYANGDPISFNDPFGLSGEELSVNIVMFLASMAAAHPQVLRALEKVGAVPGISHEVAKTVEGFGKEETLEYTSKYVAKEMVKDGAKSAIWTGSKRAASGAVGRTAASAGLRISAAAVGVGLEIVGMFIPTTMGDSEDRPEWRAAHPHPKKPDPNYKVEAQQ